MSLSITCLKQHEKENAIAKKWVLRGLLIAAGAHLGLIPLMAFVPVDVAKPPERIELVVTGPTEPIETPETVLEEVPPDETVEALTEAVAQAELAAEAQVSGGISAPPPLAAFQAPSESATALAEPSAEPFEPSEPEIAESEIVESEIVESEIVESEIVEPEIVEPEIVEEPEAVEPEVVEDSETTESTETADEPSEATEPEVATEAEEPTETETVESDSEPVETAANNTADNNSPDLDVLRDRLNRARAREANRAGTGSSSDADAENAEVDSSGATPTAPTNSSTGVARSEGPSEGSGAGSASGNGDGDRSGATTVSCRKCDRPEYPEEALAEGVEGSPSVSIEYDENGNVIGAVLEQSSGNAALDRAALEAARSYEMDSGGRSGSVSVEIDFGIEGSERSRAAQQRGERESVSNSAPTPVNEQEVVRGSVPEQASPAPATTTPNRNTPTSQPEDILGAPLPASSEQPTVPETTPKPEPVAPPPEPIAPPPEPVAPPPEPIAPQLEPIAPQLEPIAPQLEPAPIPDIMSPE